MGIGNVMGASRCLRVLGLLSKDLRQRVQLTKPVGPTESPVELLDPKGPPACG